MVVLQRTNSVPTTRRLPIGVLATLIFFLTVNQASLDTPRALYWTELTASSLVDVVRYLAPLAVALALGAMVLRCATGKFMNPLGIAAFLWVGVHLLAAARSLGASDVTAIKYLQSATCLSVLLLYFSTLFRRYKSASLVIFDQSLLYAAGAIVALNLINILLGHGYVPGNPRLFGAAPHPNFLGVQLAVCFLILLTPRLGSGPFYKVISTGLLIAAAYLLVQTGSRTAMLMVATGLAANFAIRSKNLGQFGLRVLLITSLLLALLAIGAADMVQIDALLRSTGADTRSAAWGAMWEMISEHPLWGAGTFGWATENSFLKGWSAFGFLYALGFLCVTATVLLALGHRSIGTRGGEHYFAIACAMVAGGIFEGYLVENIGFATVIWTILIAIAGMPVAMSEAGSQAGGHAE